MSRALGVEDVHVYRFEDRSVRRLTFDRLKIHNLDWSAAGDAVVFSSNRGGPFRLWQVPVAGGEPTLVPGASARLGETRLEDWLRQPATAR